MSKKYYSKGHYDTRATFGFAYKKPYECSICHVSIDAGLPYFNFSFAQQYYGNFFMVKICPKCLQKELNNQKKYLKEGGFDLWLKEKVAVRLMKNGKKNIR